MIYSETASRRETTIGCHLWRTWNVSHIIRKPPRFSGLYPNRLGGTSIPPSRRSSRAPASAPAAAFFTSVCVESQSRVPDWSGVSRPGSIFQSVFFSSKKEKEKRGKSWLIMTRGGGKFFLPSFRFYTAARRRGVKCDDKHLPAASASAAGSYIVV